MSQCLFECDDVKNNNIPLKKSRLTALHEVVLTLTTWNINGNMQMRAK